MEWLAALIAVVAAGAAFWQASEARAARKDAKKSAGLAGDAVTAAKSSAVAAERSADALEEQTRILRQGLPVTQRWQVRPIGPGSATVRNVMNRRVFDLQVLPRYVSPSATFNVVTEDLSAVDSRGIIEVAFRLALDEADFVRFDVSWVEADKPGRVFESLTINRPARREAVVL